MRESGMLLNVRKAKNTGEAAVKTLSSPLKMAFVHQEKLLIRKAQQPFKMQPGFNCGDSKRGLSQGAPEAIAVHILCTSGI